MPEGIRIDPAGRERDVRRAQTIWSVTEKVKARVERWQELQWTHSLTVFKALSVPLQGEAA